MPSRFRTSDILDGIPDAVLLLDNDFKIIYMNSEAARQMNVATVEAYVGQDLWEAFPALRETRFFRECTRAMADGVTVEYDANFESTKAWHHVRAHPTPQGLCIYSLDITARRNAEVALLEQTQVLESLNRVGVLIASELDVTKVVQAVADAASQITEAQFGAFFYNVENTDADAYLLHMREGVRQGRFAKIPATQISEILKPVLEGEGVIRLDDAALEPGLGNIPLFHGVMPDDSPLRSYLAVSLRAGTGKIIGGLFLGHADAGVFTRFDEQIVAGITGYATVSLENARLYQQAIDTNQALEQRVAERTAQLQRLNDLLQASNRELQDFASVASHDLQEPLRKIRAFGDRLMQRAGEELGAENRDSLARMQSAATRMQTLINDLLMFSRVTSRGQPFAVVDLNQIIAEVLSDLEERITQSAAQVWVAPSMPTIEADYTQIRQLLQNLVANGLKFHLPGKQPAVRVEVTEVDYNSATDAFGERLVQISVRDNGIGFDEKYLDRIFTVFQRLHGRGSYEGNGIGLAVCRRIVERHHGTITARSTPGEGATFVVTLPLRQAPLTPAEITRPIAASGASPNDAST